MRKSNDGPPNSPTRATVGDWKNITKRLSELTRRYYATKDLRRDSGGEACR
jgi:hypothetical protein